MVAVFTREEIDFYVNVLGGDPTGLIAQVKAYRNSGELITVNEVRRQIRFWGASLPDHPDESIGNALLDGSPCPESNRDAMKFIGLFAHSTLRANNAALADDAVFAEAYPRLAELLK